MGGFMLYNVDGPPLESYELASRGEIDFPDLTESEIIDKRKGDVESVCGCSDGVVRDTMPGANNHPGERVSVEVGYR
jgi:hypothetical protein